MSEPSTPREPPILKELVDAFVSVGDSREPESVHKLRALATALQLYPGPWSRLWYVRSGEGGVAQVNPLSYARLFARYVSEGADDKSAIARIEHDLRVKRARGACFLELIGPKVMSVLHLTSGISIIPGGLPNAEDYARFERFDHRWMPRCCVRVDKAVESPIVCVEPGAAAPQYGCDSTAPQLQSDVNGVLAALLFPCPVTPTWATFAYDEEESALLSMQDFGRHGHAATSWPRFVAASPALDEERTRLAWAGFMRMSETDKDTMRLTCERINRASAQFVVNKSNTCIETAIALEAMFGSGGADSVTYKLSTRAARFLRSDSQERAKVQKLFSRVYGARSKIVHGRVADARILGEDLLAFCAMVADAAVRMMTDGAVPDDATLDFG